MDRVNQQECQEQRKEHRSVVNRFFRAFIAAFCIMAVAFVGIRAAGEKLGEVKLFGSGGPVLEDDLALETLVPENSPFFDAFKKSGRVNILILGVNTNLTDTIMLASFDTKNKRADVISLPRDTYYERRGYSSKAERKLNAAYKGNPVNTAQAVSDLLMGMPINYYAVVEYDDIVKIVDAMGGVPVDIPFKMDYDDVYDEPPLHIHFKKGPATLDGEDAVKFLRYRKNNNTPGYLEGDLGRVKAQQQFVKNAFKQAMGLDFLKVVKVGMEEVESDISLGTALRIGTKAMGMSAENITAHVLPNTPDPEPPYYVYPDEKKIEELVKSIYSEEIGETKETGGEGGDAMQGGTDGGDIKGVD